ncbi:MAG: ABC transporter substrate-binding protein [Planctomycetota bacterium]|jgi:ABC-type branched-subunit amino acid transport system substrate-binding protein
MLLGAAALALMTGPADLRGQEPGPQEEEPARYGKTPDTAIPYRNFREPYKRFFQERMEFLGVGRDQELATLPETVRVGFFAPLGSAPDSDLGEEMLKGVQLAFDQANAAGGYEGIPFELIVRPDLALWGASSNVMIAFKYEDDVLAVIGAIDGANTHIALRVVLKTQMLLVNTGDTDPTLTETNIPWLMRCMADDRQQGYALAHHIFRECGIEKVVALRVNNHYGRMGIGEFRDAARRLKRPLRIELRWNHGERDFGVQLDRIAEIDPEAIVLWGSAADAAAVVREIRRRQMPVRIFGSDRLVSRAFLETAGEAAEGVVAAATYDPTREDPQLQAFTEAFGERFGHPPEAFAAHTYDGANMLIAAIRKAGLNRARIRDAIYEYTHYEGVTGPIEFDTTLNDVGPVYIATVEDGKFVYREVDFASQEQAKGGVAPYRRMAQSPPAVRSPVPAVGAVPSAYRIGCFLPLDDAGQAAVRGARMALADDAARYPGKTPIELLVRDARAAWGGENSALVDLVFADKVLAVVGSTERRATHLVETLAAKLHFPVVTLCGTDPTITQIPLPWVFCLAGPGAQIDPDFACRHHQQNGERATTYAALGYDAAALVAARIRSGGDNRVALREGLAADRWNRGVSGIFRFDALGNRLDGTPHALGPGHPGVDLGRPRSQAADGGGGRKARNGLETGG